ncbi:hypothetical protein Tco_0287714 [Tanacetum coccineum]
MREKSKEENVNYDYCEIETKNVELENSVAKLLSKNERLCKEINHVKQVFKDQFDSIKKTRVRTKEQSDSLIDKLNLKCAENENLKAQIQDKLDLEPLAPRRKSLEFEVRDRVLLKVTPWKGVVRFGKKGKLAPRFDNQFIERDRLIGIGFVLDFVEFISFTFSDKEMISVIEAVSC